MPCFCGNDIFWAYFVVTRSPSRAQFDDSYEIVQGLVDEYKAAETDDYLSWSGGGIGGAGGFVESAAGPSASSGMYGSIDGGGGSGAAMRGAYSSDASHVGSVTGMGGGGAASSASFGAVPAASGVGGLPRRASSVSALGASGSSPTGTGHGYG